MGDYSKIITAHKTIIEDVFETRDRDEMLEMLIDVLTAETELSELLDLMEEKTHLEDVYEATEAYIAKVRLAIANEDIACDSVFKRIQEDCKMDMLRDATEGRR